MTRRRKPNPNAPSSHPLYRVWLGMKQRCNNPRCHAYKYYGAIGIRVLFKNFDEFIAEMGSKPSPLHSVDRINPHGNYERGNVRWATPLEQAHNFRAGAHFNQLKTHCKRGHEFTDENTYYRADRPGVRCCKACKAITDHNSGVRRTEGKVKRRFPPRLSADLLQQAEQSAVALREGRESYARSK